MKKEDEKCIEADSSAVNMNQISKTNYIDDIKKRRSVQNRIRCKRYRDKKKANALVNPQIRLEEEEEEKIRRRREQNKEKSRRYRNRKRASNLSQLQTEL